MSLTDGAIPIDRLLAILLKIVENYNDKLYWWQGENI